MKISLFAMTLGISVMGLATKENDAAISEGIVHENLINDIKIKSAPSMPEGIMGYVQFVTTEGHVLHIGKGGICLYEQGKWQRWCK